MNFYATLRPIVGGKKLDLDLPAQSSVQDMLNELLVRFPAIRSHLYDEQGELQGAVHIFLNGRDAHYLPDGLRSRILPEDTVDIFPPVGGG